MNGEDLQKSKGEPDREAMAEYTHEKPLLVRDLRGDHITLFADQTALPSKTGTTRNTRLLLASAFKHIAYMLSARLRLRYLSGTVVRGRNIEGHGYLARLGQTDGQRGHRP